MRKEDYTAKYLKKVDNLPGYNSYDSYTSIRLNDVILRRIKLVTELADEGRITISDYIGNILAEHFDRNETLLAEMLVEAIVSPETHQVDA